MHTVVDFLCTGCELCVPVCPVDCIALVNASGERSGWAAWSSEEADRARARYARHREHLQAPASAGAGAPDSVGSRDAPVNSAIVAAAIARARAARSTR
jgi:electron transport complex protein RnfB